MIDHPPSALSALLFLLLASACSPGSAPIDAAAHRADVEAWKEKRLASLRQPDGWLSLVGLHWLDEGPSTFGSSPDAEVRMAGEGVPSILGTYVVEGRRVTFTAARGAAVMGSEGPVTTVTAYDPDDGSAPRLRRGSLSWHVIRRGDRFAVRVRDSESPVLAGFEGIDMFPVDRAWRVAGRFEPYDPPRMIRVPSILGGENETPARGALVFELGRETYRLDVWEDSDDPGNHFTAFGDATNGSDTYGGGRFLWVDAPEEGSDRVIIDFNRAYNPPCVFTPYATCPLPPRQNRLPVGVPAGERSWGAHGKSTGDS